MSAARRERLFFHLQVAAGRLRADADRRCLDHAGVTTAQAAALAVVAEDPGISQRQLARTLGQAEPSITALVRRLVDAGFLDRTIDPDDGRARRLAVTPRGTDALSAAEVAFTAVNARIDEVLSPDEVTALTSALRRLGADRPSAPER